jgi:hypothetical protein
MKTLLNLILITFLIISTGFCQANKKDRAGLVGQNFPNLSAETLSGKTINFPKDTKGKFTIICIAFSDDAQPKVDTWTKAVLEKYPKNEVNFFEVPMLKKGLKFMRGIIDGGMRKGVPTNLHDKVATFYGDLTPYKTQLMMADKDEVYLFLLDSNGKIIHIAEASANPEKVESLFQKIK